MLVTAFLAACWWQVTRALGGNALSWAYVFEWPLFAGYLIYMWRRLSRERAPGDAGTEPEPAAAEGVAGEPSLSHEGDDENVEEDEELAAYNQYLASLQESGRRKRW